MSSAFLAQAEQHQQLEWLGGGTMSILLDSEATDGQLLVARFDANGGAASPYHLADGADGVGGRFAGGAPKQHHLATRSLRQCTMAWLWSACGAAAQLALPAWLASISSAGP